MKPTKFSKCLVNYKKHCDKPEVICYIILNDRIGPSLGVCIFTQNIRQESSLSSCFLCVV